MLDHQSASGSWPRATQATSIVLTALCFAALPLSTSALAQDTNFNLILDNSIESVDVRDETIESVDILDGTATGASLRTIFKDSKSQKALMMTGSPAGFFAAF